MKRPLRPDEKRLWAAVAHTVRPAPGRAHPVIDETEPEAAPPAKARKSRAAPKPAPAPTPVEAPVAPAAPKPHRLPPRSAVDAIEPRRKRRLVRERDPIEGRIDLHGLTLFAAEDRLKAYLRRAHEDGLRAVLVITGKGVGGDGVIRRFASEWLADPALRHVVAGYSIADRRHGGEGALYVALKRRAAI